VQGETARPIATIVPKASPATRKPKPFPGFETPAAAPARRDEIAGSQSIERQPGEVAVSARAAAGPVAPLSDYSLPPRRFAEAEILRLADRLETNRIALRPSREIGLK
jgi:hypothetical protein